MARNKLLYIKEARQSLTSALAILEPNEAEAYELQELKTAAKQAEQAAATLNQLIGVVDAQSDLPKRKPTA